MDSLRECCMDDASLKIQFLIKELLSRKGSNGKLINICLSKLNEMDHRTVLGTDHDAVMLLVNQLCTSVQPTDTALVKSTSEFLTTLMKIGAIFQGRILMACERWILETLEYSELVSRANILVALQTLLATAPFIYINQEIRKFLGENALLWRFLFSPGSQCPEIIFLALCCLEAILINKEKNEATIATIYLLKIKQVVMSVLLSLPLENGGQYFNKIIFRCVRILRIITSDRIMVDSSDKIGEMLGVIQALLFHGIEDYPCIKPQKLYPAAMNLPERIPTIPRKKNVRSKKAKSRKQTPKKSALDVIDKTFSDSQIINMLSSDPDTSDTEAASSTIQVEWKVRMETVKLFHKIVLIVPSRDLFGYWTQIVASGSVTNARVITTLILKENSYKVLQIVLSTLAELLRGAKTILMHAEEVKCTSFITFFAMVSSVIKELHYTISLFMHTARNITILTHTLKCATALVESTPYHRLRPGLASRLIRNCRDHTLHKDPTVRVAALRIFEALASSEPITSEILDIIGMSSNADNYFESSTSNNNLMNNGDVEVEVSLQGLNGHINIQDPDIKNMKDEQMSPLLEICLENISNETVSAPVRLQSFKLLGVLTCTAGSLVFLHLETIATKLATASQELEPQISLHACRVIEIIAEQLVATKLNDPNSLLFWKIVCKPITSLVQHSETILKEVACDCLGNIGLNVFAQLPREESVLIITLLFGATRDCESAVRAAGLRTLGLLVALPALEEDAGFIMDLAEISYSTLQDCNLGVRIKAAWALASLCDYLIRRENNTDVEPLSLDILLPKTYESSVKATKDNDKVKCNATRIVGSVLFLCRDNSILGDTTEGLEALIQCASVGNDQKVRWNACRAIGLILSREPDHIFPKSWKEQVFPTLCNLVCDSPNFKVRINAAWALSVCNSYGKHVTAVWKSTILALENSQHVPNYIEYAHRDTLVHQLCLTLCHLAVHMDITELMTLWVEIRDHIDDVKFHMQQFQNHVLPEKADDLLDASVRFSKYEQDAPTIEEKRIAKKLKNLFEKKDYEENIHICV